MLLQKILPRPPISLIKMKTSNTQKQISGFDFFLKSRGFVIYVFTICALAVVLATFSGLVTNAVIFQATGVLASTALVSGFFAGRQVFFMFCIAATRAVAGLVAGHPRLKTFAVLFLAFGFLAIAGKFRHHLFLLHYFFQWSGISQNFSLNLLARGRLRFGNCYLASFHKGKVESRTLNAKRRN